MVRRGHHHGVGVGFFDQLQERRHYPPDLAVVRTRSALSRASMSNSSTKRPKTPFARRQRSVPGSSPFFAKIRRHDRRQPDPCEPKTQFPRNCLRGK